MSQSDLDRAVARATGETVTEIRRLGFTLQMPRTQQQEPLPHILRFPQRRRTTTPALKRAA